ncbi:MAG: tRNA (guanine(46)-N(7))-methyltransferase TrmB [Anaerolineales bacterium]
MSRGRRISRVKFTPPTEQEAAQYLLEWDHKALYESPEQFPQLTAQTLFHADGPLSLDIGSGTGEYIHAMAQTHLDEYFLGVEISRRVTYYAVKQAAQEGLENLKFIKADFRLLYPLFAPASLENVYLNFPDPNYGGQKNRKNRVFSPEFLDLIAKALIPEGRLQVVTDQQPFLIDMLEIAEEDTRFCKTHSERFLTDFSPPTKTRFQRAWEKFDRPVYRFELKLQG